MRLLALPHLRVLLRLFVADEHGHLSLLEDEHVVPLVPLLDDALVRDEVLGLDALAHQLQPLLDVGPVLLVPELLKVIPENVSSYEYELCRNVKR